MDSINPYESPRTDEIPVPSRPRSTWSGPLFSLSVFWFLVAFLIGSSTFVVQALWIQYLVTLALFAASVVSLGFSFFLYRRARQIERMRNNDSGRSA